MKNRAWIRRLFTLIVKSYFLDKLRKNLLLIVCYVLLSRVLIVFLQAYIPKCILFSQDRYQNLLFEGFFTVFFFFSYIFSIYHNNPKYWDRQVWENSDNPAQTRQNTASNQGLQGFPLVQQWFRQIYQVVKWAFSNFRTNMIRKGVPIFRVNMVVWNHFVNENKKTKKTPFQILYATNWSQISLFMTVFIVAPAYASRTQLFKGSIA